eukprot:977863-Pyramimonas_sp.AAC.1
MPPSPTASNRDVCLSPLFFWWTPPLRRTSPPPHLRATCWLLGVVGIHQPPPHTQRWRCWGSERPQQPLSTDPSLRQALTHSASPKSASHSNFLTL